MSFKDEMMICPACGYNLQSHPCRGVQVDICHNCGGVWLDKGELDLVDEKKEQVGADIVQEASKYYKKLDTERVRMCPVCNVHIMYKFHIDVRNQVLVDQCWNCGGIWLDGEELSKVRSQYDTIEERRAEVNKYGEDILKAFPKESMQEEILERIKNRKSYLRIFDWLSG